MCATVCGDRNPAPILPECPRRMISARKMSSLSRHRELGLLAIALCTAMVTAQPGACLSPWWCPSPTLNGTFSLWYDATCQDRPAYPPGPIVTQTIGQCGGYNNLTGVAIISVTACNRTHLSMTMWPLNNDTIKNGCSTPADGVQMSMPLGCSWAFPYGLGPSGYGVSVACLNASIVTPSSSWTPTPSVTPSATATLRAALTLYDTFATGCQPSQVLLNTTISQCTAVEVNGTLTRVSVTACSESAIAYTTWPAPFIGCPNYGFTKWIRPRVCNPASGFDPLKSRRSCAPRWTACRTS